MNKYLRLRPGPRVRSRQSLIYQTHVLARVGSGHVRQLSLTRRRRESRTVYHKNDNDNVDLKCFWFYTVLYKTLIVPVVQWLARCKATLRSWVQSQARANLYGKFYLSSASMPNQLWWVDWAVVQCSGNALVSTNTVALHWAWLVVGWVTAFRQVNRLTT